MIRFQNWMNQNPWFSTINLVVFFFLLNLVAASIPWQLDLTRDGVNSVSPSSARVLSRLKDPLYVDAYITADLPGEILTALRPTRAKLQAFARAGGSHVKLRLINPDTPEKMEEAEKAGIQGIPVEEARVDRISQRMGYFGVRLKMGSKSTIVPLVENGGIVQDLEYRLLREVKKMGSDHESSGIAFLTGPGLADMERWRSRADQRKDNQYGIRSLMEKDLGRVDTVPMGEPVPPGVKSLIVTGLPEMDDVARFHLDQFLLQGGNLILLLKSFDFDDSPPNPMMMQLGLGSQGGGFASVDAKKLEAVNKWLSSYGLHLDGKIVFEPTMAARTLDMQGKYIGLIPNPAWAVYSRDSDTLVGNLPSIETMEQVVVPWFSGLDVTEASQPDVAYTTLLQTGTRAVLRESSSLDLKDIQGVGGSPGDEWSGRNIPVAVLATGKFRSEFSKDTIPDGLEKESWLEEGRSDRSSILIMGTSYFLSDMLLQNDVNVQAFQLNQAFLLNLLEGMGGDQDLAEARARVPGIFFMEKPGEPFESIFSWLHVTLFPLLLGIYGFFRLWKRNRKQGIGMGDRS